MKTLDLTELVPNLIVPGLDLKTLPDPDPGNLSLWANVSGWWGTTTRGACVLLRRPADAESAGGIVLPDQSKTPEVAGWVLSLPSIAIGCLEVGDVLQFPYHGWTEMPALAKRAHGSDMDNLIGLVECSELMLLHPYGDRVVAPLIPATMSTGPWPDTGHASLKGAPHE